MINKPNFDIDYRCVADIFECRTISEIKAAVEAFIAATDKVRGEYNGMLVWGLCQRFEKTFSEWAKQYKSPPKGAAWNAVIVLPEHSPIMFLLSCVPFGGTPNDIIAGLKKFIERCNEFTPPKHDAATLTEIKKVLTYAQKTYRLIDIIAPNEPMKILRFANSHAIYNSQCGFSSDPSRPSTIFSYHPKDNAMCDRLFIFAHELGHALHFALTRDIDILPEGFDEFNKKQGAKPETLKDKQEAFADSAALAILNTKGLRTHFPTEWSKAVSHSHANYIRELCSNALKNSGLLHEPLPLPFSPFDKVLRGINERRTNIITANNTVTAAGHTAKN